jgi:SAM-dependent methyltransferase
MTTDARRRIWAMQDAAADRGEPLAWYDELYRLGDAGLIPWADLRPNPFLAGTLPSGNGEQALVVGCGLGDDAEYVASHGWRVTAFDVSPAAIAWCRRRFPASSVCYRAADLLAGELGRHALVVEIYTVQSMPLEMRPAALRAIANLVADRLLLIGRGAENGEDRNLRPCPLTPDDLAVLPRCGLDEESREEFRDPDDPGVRRFRAWYRRVREVQAVPPASPSRRLVAE